jgi:L-amino acid N-acyltransferase YncA
MLKLAEQGYIESGLPGLFNQAHFSKWWEKADDLGFAYMWVLERGGKLVGLLNALRSLEMFTGRSQLSVVNWYITPKHRGCGLKLLRACLKYARDEKIRMVTIGCVPNELGRRASLLYAKLKFHLSEQTFVLERD